jgi:hypothetical protein
VNSILTGGVWDILSCCLDPSVLQTEMSKQRQGEVTLLIYCCASVLLSYNSVIV